MQATTNLKKQAKTIVLTAAAVASMLLTGYATAQTVDVNRALVQPQVRADVIYVTPFAATTDMVKLDSGLSQKVKAMATGESSASMQYDTVMEAREALANEIVHELQAKGLRAERLDGPVPANANAIIVTGDFDKIDEGKSRRRMLVGLGAGKSDVAASVQLLYKPAQGLPVALERFTSNADSGHMPGVAETAGVGAVAGHVAVSAAAGAGVHGASEIKQDTISADARRLADAIAKQVVADNTANGWVRNSSI